MFSKKLSRAEAKEEREEFMNSFTSVGTHSDSLSYEPIVGCCGVGVLSYWENQAVSQYKKYKKPIIKFLKEDFDWRIDGEYTPGSVVTTIADFQVDGVVPILKALGFKLVSKGTNGNTGNSVFVWAKTLQPTKNTGQPTVRRVTSRRKVK